MIQTYAIVAVNSITSSNKRMQLLPSTAFPYQIRCNCGCQQHCLIKQTYAILAVNSIASSNKHMYAIMTVSSIASSKKHAIMAANSIASSNKHMQLWLSRALPYQKKDTQLWQATALPHETDICNYGSQQHCLIKQTYAIMAVNSIASLNKHVIMGVNCIAS